MNNITLNIPRKAAIAGTVLLVVLLVLGAMGAVHRTGQFHRQEVALKASLDRWPVVGSLSKKFFHPRPPQKVSGELVVVQRNQEKLAVAYEAAGVRLAEIEQEKEKLAQQVKAQNQQLRNTEKLLEEISRRLNDTGAKKKNLADIEKTAQKAALSVRRDLEKELKPQLSRLNQKVSQKSQLSEKDLARQNLNFKRLSKVYAEMDADVIAEIFQDKTLKESQSVEILRRLPKDKISEVLAAMDASTAAAYTRLLAERAR